MDNQFCERRLNPNGGGFLFLTQNANGGTSIQWTQQPINPLSNFTASQNVAFGQLVFIGADNIERALNGPAVANLVLTTNAAGQLLFAAPPTPTIPDPLTVNTIHATNFTLGNGTITGAVALTGLGTGTLVSTLGLDGSGNVIKGTPSNTGSQCAMFFEAPTSPSPTTPNSTITAGAVLTIGNLLFDSVLPAVSGGALFTVTNSQTLACATAGTYVIEYGGEVVMNANTGGTPSIQLLVNGIIVNNGFTRTGNTGTPNRVALTCPGVHARRFVAGDTVQLQMASGSGSNISAYEVRLVATRTGP